MSNHSHSDDVLPESGSIFADRIPYANRLMISFLAIPYKHRQQYAGSPNDAKRGSERLYQGFSSSQFILKDRILPEVIHELPKCIVFVNPPATFSVE